MLDAALVVSRLLHFGCLTALFGAAAFPLYAVRGPSPAAWTPPWRLFGLIALAGAIVSGAAWFVFTAAGMSGETASALDPANLKSVLTDTAFGHVWTLRLVLAAAGLLVLSRASGKAGMAMATALCALLLASLALTGHAQAEEGAAGVMHAAADAIHLLTAGAWIGGLFGLAFAVGRTGAPGEPPLAQVLSNFSGMAYTAVALLVLTGLMNSLFVLAAPSALLTTGYGRLLSLKLLLFAAMLALATANRFWISPALARPGPDRPLWLERLKRHILAEQVLAGLVLAVVALLGTLDPGT